MAIKLHRCSGTWAKFSGHPCWRVQKGLNKAGIEYQLVKEGSAFRGSSRVVTEQRTGQRKFPWIEFDDGTVYREESRDMAETIRAGKLEQKRMALRGEVPEAAQPAGMPEPLVVDTGPAKGSEETPPG